MADRAKETVSFRIVRERKEALTKLAATQGKALGELVREVVDEYVAREERRAWEAEARRAARALADEAKDPDSDEAEVLGLLEANLEEFAEEWIWDEET